MYVTHHKYHITSHTSHYLLTSCPSCLCGTLGRNEIFPTLPIFSQFFSMVLKSHIRFYVPHIAHRTSHIAHRTSHITHTHHTYTSHKISLTCRKCGLASAKPVAMLSDKYIEGLTQCCWTNKKNRIVMTGRGSMAKEAAYDSFKLRTPDMRRWNTTIPTMILQKKTVRTR